MSKNGKLLKYEVINTKKDKKLIGEVFDFKKLKQNVVLVVMVEENQVALIKSLYLNFLIKLII